jgi:thioredoxin-like negative regulator of GroEL
MRGVICPPMLWPNTTLRSVAVARINCAPASATASKLKSLKVEALPTFILYKNGKEVKRKQGLVTQEEFNSWLD